MFEIAYYVLPLIKYHTKMLDEKYLHILPLRILIHIYILRRFYFYYTSMNLFHYEHENLVMYNFQKN